jgi:hypothetical protein
LRCSAFDAAIDLARRYDAELLAVSIANAPADAETTADRDDSASAARLYFESTFAEVRDRAERAGVGVEHRTIEASAPARALAEYAREHGFDLIVCGHHHSRRAGRLLLRGARADARPRRNLRRGGGGGEGRARRPGRPRLSVGPQKLEPAPRAGRRPSTW